MTEHPALSPVRVGDLDLGNRLAVAPMSRVSANADGTATREMAEYYREFVRGGFGLVITEGTYPDAAHSQGYLNQPGIVTDEHVAAWRQVTDGVHGEGGLIVQQLMHAGALSQGNPHSSRTIAPSAIKPLGEMLEEYGGSGPYAMPSEMTEDDMEAVIEGFVSAALNSRRAGFDGVEIHASNGYLLDQFLTAYTNQRADAYGGDVRYRVRLTEEVVAAVRGAVGPAFCLGVRLSQTKVNDFVYRWPGGAVDGEVIFEALRAVGVTYLHIASEGRDWIETATLDGGETITALAKRVSGLPVIANGGMHDPARAAMVLEEGHADLLSLGRGALANPDLPRRLALQDELEVFDHAMLQPMATLANVEQWRQATGVSQ